MSSDQHAKSRPWGHYCKIFQESGVWVKRVEVDPGCRLSLQRHHHRSEKWVIVSGEGLVVVNNLTVTVAAGSVVDIPVRVLHRIANVGKVPLVFIEVACGDRLTEEDIIRLQDDYERAMPRSAANGKKRLARSKS